MNVRSFVAGAAAAGAMLLASPGWAGQAGSVSTTATTDSSTSAGTSDTIVGGISISETWDDANALTDDSIIDSAAVTLSLQVFEDGYHGYSPSNNIAEFAADVTNLNSAVTGNAGITTVQQAAGQANVSVSANTLVDLDSLAVLLGAEAIRLRWLRAFVLSPAFTLSTANRLLSPRDPRAGRCLSTAVQGGSDISAAVGDRFVSNDSYEMSPENNSRSLALCQPGRYGRRSQRRPSWRLVSERATSFNYLLARVPGASASGRLLI